MKKLFFGFFLLISEAFAGLPGLSGSVPTIRSRSLGLGIHPPGIDGAPVQKSPVETYLTAFGYTTNGPELATPFDLQMGLLRFQMYHGLYRSGLFDVETEEKMALHRCENADMENGAALKEPPTKSLWRKKRLLWSIQGAPDSLTIKETRAALQDAVGRWQGVAGFEFGEADSPKTAEILFVFEEMSDKKHPMVVSRASGPTGQSRIVFDAEQAWSYVFPYPGSLSLHRAALHSIGHSLGLQHTPDIDSLMNPLFKSAQLFSKITTIPDEDGKTLRQLYGRV